MAPPRSNVHVCLVAASIGVLWLAPARAAAPPDAEEPTAAFTLERAWEVTLARHTDVRVAQARVARTVARRRAALAPLLPTLTASAAYTLNDQESTVGDSRVTLQHDVRGWLSLDVTLFDGTLWFEYSATEHHVAAQKAALGEVRQDCLLEVARTYYAALLADRLMAVAQWTKEARTKYLEAAQVRRKAGHAVALDIARAEAGVHRAERELVQARHLVEEARDTLALAIGVERDPSWRLVRASVANEPEPTQGQAEVVRDALRQHEAHIAGLEEQRTAAWMALVPTLTLTGVLAAGEAYYADPDGLSGALFLELKWTLYDGGARYAKLDENSADLDAARSELQRSRLRVAADVRLARRQIATKRERLAATRAELAAAKRAHELALRGFQLGNGIGLDVLAAQEVTVQAEVTLAREELELDLALLRLLRGLGDLGSARARTR